MSKKVSWLHLSDLHLGLGSDRALWPALKATFIDDLKRMCPEVGHIDVVIFSGDLTQQGSKDQFNQLTDELIDIWRIWDGAKPPVLFPVPGNHDLIRPLAADARVKLLLNWGKDKEVEQEFWNTNSSQYFPIVQEAYQNYMDWLGDLRHGGFPLASLIHGIIPGDVSCTVESDDGARLGLVGLNSAFLQLGKGDFQQRLAVDVRQINAVTNNDPSSWCGGHDYNFLVTHHPTSWLSPVSQEQFVNEVSPQGRFTAHFYGHMHEADLHLQSKGGGPLRRNYQSHSLLGLEYVDEEEQRTHGYSLGWLETTSPNIGWRLWPRTLKKRPGGGHRFVPDHDHFDIVHSTNYQEDFTAIGNTAPIVESLVHPVVSVGKTSKEQWTNALQSALYALSAQPQHRGIRYIEQHQCKESLRQHRLVWICADWGLGHEGFIWATIQALSQEILPIYRISLSNYDSREKFLSSFKGMSGCTFPDFCQELSNSGAGSLLLDDVPTGMTTGGTIPIEIDIEALATTVKDFCPNLNIFMLARSVPKQAKVPTVQLGPLDEADTKTYLEAHPEATREVQSSFGVSEIYRRTEGFPNKIDSTLRRLRVVSLAELGPAIGDEGDIEDEFSRSLIKAVSDLMASTDERTKRSVLLLKALSILPHGESLQRLKRIDNRYPIFPRNAEELLDQDLIKVRTSSGLIDGSNRDSEQIRILYAQRPVRDYVLSTLAPKEAESLVESALSLYFGEGWRHGKAALKRDVRSKSNDGAMLENPHILLVRQLKKEATWSDKETATQLLALSQIYCSTLLEEKNYRHCVLACRDVLGCILEEGYEGNRNTINFLLAKSLRMIGQLDEALTLFEKLLEVGPSKEIKITQLLEAALCLQQKDPTRAGEYARQVVKLAPKSAPAAQAKAIMLELENEDDKSAKLLKLETESRKRGHITTANNLTLRRIDRTLGSGKEASLRTVYSSAIEAGDIYTASRATIKLCSHLLDEVGTLSRTDLNRLVASYQYVYGERFNSMLLENHRTLWRFFDAEGDDINLMSLFRHSSFVWRLEGEERHESVYIDRMKTKSRQLLACDISTVDKDTAYFISRATTVAIGHTKTQSVE